MGNVIKITESQLRRIVEKTIKESENYGVSPINKIMDLSYEIMNEYCPEGPKDQDKYMKSIKKLEKDFDYVIRNLESNVEKPNYNFGGLNPKDVMNDLDDVLKIR